MSAPKGGKVDLRAALRKAARRRARKAVDATSRSHLASVLVGSGLFDTAWYVAQAKCAKDPTQAAKHYLKTGAKKNWSPHPLFDPKFFMDKHRKKVGRRNPFVAYVSDPAFRGAEIHADFPVEEYVKAYPEALTYARRPLGHYLAVGAKAGHRLNDWYVPDPATEPEGLADWFRARRAEWVKRRVLADTHWRASAPTADQTIPKVTVYETSLSPLVSVVLPAGPAPALLESSVAAVLAQTVTDREILLVHAPGRQAETIAALSDASRKAVTLIEAETDSLASAVTAGAAAAVGEWVAFCLPTALWRPGHLAAVLNTIDLEVAEAGYDVVERTHDERDGKRVRRRATVQTTHGRSSARSRICLGSLVVRRRLLESVGGPDPMAHSAIGHDLELKLLSRGPVPLSKYVGVFDEAERREQEDAVVPLRERPRLDLERLVTWDDIVLDKHLSRWERVQRAGDPELVSVVIPTYSDSEMTKRAVETVCEAREISRAADPDAPDVEVIVLDNGCDVAEATDLDSLPLRHANVKVVHESTNRGFALGMNVAIQHTKGAVIVYLNNDTEVATGWLEPLLEALEDPMVHGAQSLLVYPSGSIQSAGIAFPASGGVPHVLLQGFPVEDAEGIQDVKFHALTAASVAMRRADIVELRGFDPIFRNGMEDVDLGLRMCALRDGHFTVRPDSVVVHHESRTPGRFTASLTNRLILLERYGDAMPGDDIDLWNSRGYDVARHEVRSVVSEDRRLAVPQPVLVRRPLLSVDERTPALRWALKNPAPSGPQAAKWGDTHFIASLAAALRRNGQQVVVDHRPEFDRESGAHDDVVLVLRGLAPYSPVYGQVSIAWLISHPEMFSRREAAGYDRVFAASKTWSKRMTEEWGVRIDPLLQATDPDLFHPDRGRPDTGHPVLFVGGSRRILRPMVRDSIERGLPLSLYGEGWDELVPAQYRKAPYLPNAEVGEAYRRAGVLLNDHWEDMRVDGFISNRLFDAAASGARVITDDVQGLDGLFGRSVLVADSADALVALATAPDLDAVFGDDEERRDVAKRVHAEHSFDARARTLIDAAAELRAGRRDHRSHR